ncbi:MAG: ATP-binding cassette domain-containing protein, partial [Gammaproteobacteria bacterium]
MLKVDIQLIQGDFRLDATLDMRDPVLGLFGPSGSGKSTLLAALAGLKQPATGRILVGERLVFDADAGINLPPYRRRVGLMFQEGHLFPHLNVRANLRYGIRSVQSVPRIFAFDRVVDLLEIAPLLARPVLSLSGGEKQRVALGRTLLAAPELL